MQTEPADWVEQSFEGYVLNAGFSDQNIARLQQITAAIQQEYRNKVFVAPAHSLHITLLDWIAPLVDYDGVDKTTLFNSIKDDYDKNISRILADVLPISIRFTELKVSPSTIFLVGHDNGEFQTIRQQFVESIELLPNTKLPPTIIHSSLARFKDTLPLSNIEHMVTNLTVDFTQQIDSFRLIHTTKEPMLEFEVLKTYHLSK